MSGGPESELGATELGTMNDPELRNESGLGFGPGIGIARGARVCDPQPFEMTQTVGSIRPLFAAKALRVSDPRSATASGRLNEMT